MAIRDRPDLLPATQFNLRSTTQALQYLLNIVYEAWSDMYDDIVTILCTDIGGAYDNIKRAELLNTLVKKGMPPWVVDFIRSFLSNRRATLNMPGHVSDLFHLNVGIPQGSPLSPILFLLFASPLLDHAPQGTCVIPSGSRGRRAVKLRAFAFVDDNYLIAVSDSRERNCEALGYLHREIEKTAEPLGIVFGPHKYHVMHFKKPYSQQQQQQQDSPHIPQIPGFNEKPQDELKILGIIVDRQLKWQAHLNTIQTKVKQRLGYLSRFSGLTWGPTLQTMRQLYLTKIRPVFTYVWRAWFIRRR